MFYAMYWDRNEVIASYYSTALHANPFHKCPCGVGLVCYVGYPSQMDTPIMYQEQDLEEMLRSLTNSPFILKVSHGGSTEPISLPRQMFFFSYAHMTRSGDLKWALFLREICVTNCNLIPGVLRPLYSQFMPQWGTLQRSMPGIWIGSFAIDIINNSTANVYLRQNLTNLSKC